MLLTDLLDELPPELILCLLTVQDLARLATVGRACATRCSDLLEAALHVKTRRQISSGGLSPPGCSWP